MLNIGVLGAARIAPAGILQPANNNPATRVVAIAARDKTRAAAMAAEYGVPHSVEGYAALIERADIDVVYNALAPRDHLQWTLRALEAGKHVLCEKPFALSAAEAATMVAAAESAGLVLMEAFHYRFHPYFSRLLRLVADQAAGRLRHIEACFDVSIPYRAGELRHEPALGGGALMDLGCYPVHWARTVVGSEPVVGTAHCETGSTGVDLTTRAELAFPAGITASVSCSMAQDLPVGHRSTLWLSCEDGEILATNPLLPHHGARIELTRNAVTTIETDFDSGTTYLHQLEHLVAVIRGDLKPFTGGADAIANMRVIDEIYRLGGVEVHTRRRSL